MRVAADDDVGVAVAKECRHLVVGCVGVDAGSVVPGRRGVNSQQTLTAGQREALFDLATNEIGVTDDSLHRRMGEGLGTGDDVAVGVAAHEVDGGQ